MRYTNNTVIFNNKGEFKGDFTYANFAFKRDLTSRTKSEITIYDEKNVIAKNDIMYLIFGTLEWLCIISEVKEDRNIKKISFYINCDIFENEVLLKTNSLANFNLTETNNSAVSISIRETDNVTTTNNFLNFDTLVRQSMRKSPKEEVVNELSLSIIPSSDQVYFIRLDDPEINVLIEEYANDTWNKLTLYSEDLNSKKSYYFDANGNLVTNASTLNYVIPKYEIVENWNDSSYAISQFKQQEYANKLEIEVPIDNNLFALQLNNKIMGRKVQIITKNNASYTTIISGIEIKDTVKMKVVFGLTRTKLTQKLRKEI